MGASQGIIQSDEYVTFVDSNGTMLENVKINQIIKEKTFDFTPEFYKAYNDPKILQVLREHYNK